MKLSLILAAATLVAGTQSWARSAKTEVNTVLVGQGISSPTVNTPVNFSNGYTHQNSAVAASVTGVEITPEYQTTKDAADNTVNQYGGELGFGNGKMGLVAGYYKQDCTGCDGYFGGIAGINFSKVGIGIGYHEKETYTGGFLFNPMGQHRIGVTVDIQNKDAAGNSNKTTAYGLGYSFDAKNWLFAIDASKHDGDAYNSDQKEIIKVTPGFQFRLHWLTAAVSYDTYINNKSNPITGSNYERDQLWGGLGVGNDRIQFAVYNKYMGQDWTGSLSFWF